MTKPMEPVRLLVGISNPDTMARLVDLAVLINRGAGGTIVVTNVVRIPGQIGLGSARSSPEVVAARRLLQDALDRCEEAGVAAEAVVEVGREIHEGLITAARSRDADLVLVGYSDDPDEADEKKERRFDRVMHRVGNELDTPLVVAKFRGVASDRVLVVLGLTSDLSLIEVLVRPLAARPAGSVSFLHVSPGGEDSEQGRAVRAMLAESSLSKAGELETVPSDDIVAAVLERADQFDLILLETSSDPESTAGLRVAEAERIAESVECSTLLARGR